MTSAENIPGIDYAYGDMYTRDGLAYRVLKQDVIVTDDDGKKSVITVEEHCVACTASVHAELERIRLKPMT